MGPNTQAEIEKIAHGLKMQAHMLETLLEDVNPQISDGSQLQTICNNPQLQRSRITEVTVAVRSLTARLAKAKGLINVA